VKEKFVKKNRLQRTLNGRNMMKSNVMKNYVNEEAGISTGTS
jgi:hypothetical protein